MKIDLNKYAINKGPIQAWYLKTKDADVCRGIAMQSATTGCPCIALAFYMAELLGFTSELVRMIDKHIQFYGYEVINQPENSPYLTKSGDSDIV